MIEKIKIVEANKNDLEELYRIERQVENLHIKSNSDYLKPVDKDVKFKYWEELLERDDASILLATIDNTIVGFCIIYNKKPSLMSTLTKVMYVEAIGVDEKFQGLGIGKSLMDYVDSYAHNNNYEMIKLNVWNFNTRAKDLYIKNGFEVKNINLEKLIK